MAQHSLDVYSLGEEEVLDEEVICSPSGRVAVVENNKNEASVLHAFITHTPTQLSVYTISIAYFVINSCALINDLRCGEQGNENVCECEI